MSNKELGVPNVKARRTLPQSLWRFCRAIGWDAVGRELSERWPFPVRTTVSNGAEMYVDLRSSIGRGLFATGSFDMAAIQPVLDELCSGSVFVDVGANVGFYSVLASTLVGETGHVYSFEIDQRPLSCLRKTLEISPLKNISVEDVALSDVDGTVTFVPEAEHGHNYIQRESNKGGLVVNSVRLDTWVKKSGLQRLDAVKIDVEGAESLVLKGAKDSINRFRPIVVCEACEHTARFGYQPDLLIEIFDDMGYDASWLEGVWTPTLLAKPRV